MVDCEKCTHHEGIKATQDAMQKDIEIFRKDILDIYDKLNGTMRKSERSDANQENMSKEIQKISDGMESFKKEIKSDMSDFKTDIKKDMSETNKAVKDVEKQLTETNKTFKDVEKQVTDLTEEVKANTEEVKASTQASKTSSKKITLAAIGLILLTTISNNFLPDLMRMLFAALSKGA